VSEEDVAYGQYAKSFEAIHSALRDIMAPSPGKKTTKLAGTWNPDGSLKTLAVSDGSELLFTLAFAWNDDGSFKEVART
jgi:hypothetical protein